MNDLLNAGEFLPEILQFPCLKDNYCFLIHDPNSGQTAVIDTPDAEEIKIQLEARGWWLTHILTTHHHWDHIDGHQELKEHYQCHVIGSEVNKDIIPGIDQVVKHKEKIKLGELEIEIIATPGHTLGHVAYWIPALKAAFVGDTLFSLGCGRLFEGKPEQMWKSIKLLRALPDETAIYCAHEYTQQNAIFALTLEPNNILLKKRVAEVMELRAAGLPTLPTSIQQERQTNPFMRADHPKLQQNLQLLGSSAEMVFTEIRRRKDKA